MRGFNRCGLKTSCLLLLAMPAVLVLTAPVDASCYTDCRIIEKQLIDFLPDCAVKYCWYHKNPAEIAGGGPLTPEEYAEAACHDLVTVTLAIQVDDLDCGDQVKVYIEPVGQDDWVYLGELNRMAFTDCFGLVPGADLYQPGHMTVTEFDVDPCWLDGLPVRIRLSGNLCNINSLEIEKSTLTVCMVPAPAAVVLGAIGLATGLLTWRRRRPRNV
ncbi:MAG: hypothetical protein GXY33_19010 [Phycisphaerae bacterium]|nr:hypothetical protein [Phycisphaerae bacterium]